MSFFDELRALGVNVDEGLKRINGNENLYKRLLGSFLKAIDANYVSADFDFHDYQDVIEKTHALKGTSGNLSLTPIYEAYTQIVDLLRAGKPEEAQPILEKILPVQEEIIQCIKRNIE